MGNAQDKPNGEEPSGEQPEGSERGGQEGGAKKTPPKPPAPPSPRPPVGPNFRLMKPLVYDHKRRNGERPAPAESPRVRKPPARRHARLPAPEEAEEDEAGGAELPSPPPRSGQPRKRRRLVIVPLSGGPTVPPTNRATPGSTYSTHPHASAGRPDEPFGAQEAAAFFGPPENAEFAAERRDRELADPPESAAELERLKAEFRAARCGFCHARLPLALRVQPCRCARLYCRQHRQPERHCCSVDWKRVDRAKLEAAVVSRPRTPANEDRDDLADTPRKGAKAVILAYYERSNLVTITKLILNSFLERSVAGSRSYEADTTELNDLLAMLENCLLHGLKSNFVMPSRWPHADLWTLLTRVGAEKRDFGRVHQLHRGA
ncbi:RUN domain-containing protein [Aphelenchoides fujianensis]|nr:RUN domain-containing protein [Aphelenchoides fujianensis]